MERRAFVSAVAGLAAAGTAGGVQAAAGSQAVLVRSYVTGIPAEASGLIADAERGDRLRLVRIHHRKFDPHSIEVRSERGELLGYLPGMHSRILAPLMEHGLALHARTIATRHRPRSGMQVDVVLSA